MSGSRVLTRRAERPAVLSCGVVLVRWCDEVPHYLLLRVYRHWDFPKGILEPGEEPLAGAIREVREETTLTDLRFHWGHEYRQTEVYRGNKAARFFLAEAPTGTLSIPVNPELGWPEHHEGQWFVYDDAFERLGARLRPILAWAHSQIDHGS